MPQPIRSLKLHDKSYEFVNVPLAFANDRHENVFAKKNNKTVRETIAHRRYKRLAAACLIDYSQHLDSPLGQVLLELKLSGDSFYQHFLNPYGDQVYSTFSISDLSSLEARGVYAYYADDTLKYIGRCRDALKKRVDQGYWENSPEKLFSGRASNELSSERTYYRQPFPSVAMAPPDGQRWRHRGAGAGPLAGIRTTMEHPAWLSRQQPSRCAQRPARPRTPSRLEPRPGRSSSRFSVAK